MSKMKIAHVFQETKPALMKEHMKNWFGVVPMELENPETGAYLACYCGAWLEPMEFDKDVNITVAAIWHQRKYHTSE
jgi:hypothetical protein